MPGSPLIQDIIGRGLFDRLPATFATYTFDRIRDWNMLFPAEQDYFERLLGLLDRSDRALVDRLFAPLADVERQMSIDRRKWNTREFTLAHVDFLQRSPFYPQWRARIAELFSRIDPVLDEEIARKGRPRLVIVASPSELPAPPERMWKRIDRHGQRVALAVPDSLGASDFLPILLTGKPRPAAAPSLLDLYQKAAYGAWLVEAGSALAPLTRSAVALSYGELDDYRNRLMAAVRNMLDAKQLRGPRELGAELRKLKVPPPPTRAGSDPLLTEFLRSVLLTGNGTLLINNTFAEWATIQAVRRARPVLTVLSFGIRNKIKPFSSLLIYTDQETANPIPTQMDVLGTYVDLEIFYQYVWQEFEKYAEYRHNTAYLFVSEGMEEMLVIAPPDFPLKQREAPVSLDAVHAAAKEWLGI